MVRRDPQIFFHRPVRVRAYRELFASQFALLSSGYTEEPDPEKLLFKESDCNYSFFASVLIPVAFPLNFALLHRDENMRRGCLSISPL